MKTITFAGAALLALGGCEGGGESPAEPAVQVAALEGDLFTLQGNLRFNTCDPTPRAVSGAADFRARGRSSPTCDALTGQDQLDCIAFVQPSASTSLIPAPSFVAGPASPGAESHPIPPHRVFPGGTGHYAFADDVHPTPYSAQKTAEVVLDLMTSAGWH